MGKAKGLLGKYGASYFLLSFWLILFLVFTVIPIAISVVMSFTDFDMVRLPRFVGLQNYTTLFLDDDIFIKSLGNTLFYALVTGPAGYLLSFLVAWLLSETSRGVRAVLMLIFYAPTLAGNVYMVWTDVYKRQGIFGGNGAHHAFALFVGKQILPEVPDQHPGGDLYLVRSEKSQKRVGIVVLEQPLVDTGGRDVYRSRVVDRQLGGLEFRVVGQQIGLRLEQRPADNAVGVHRHHPAGAGVADIQQVTRCPQPFRSGKRLLFPVRCDDGVDDSVQRQIAVQHDDPVVAGVGYIQALLLVHRHIPGILKGADAQLFPIKHPTAYVTRWGADRFPLLVVLVAFPDLQRQGGWAGQQSRQTDGEGGGPYVLIQLVAPLIP